MLLSQSAEYAIRAVLHLASQSDERFVGVNEIARSTGASTSYLAKVLGQLVRAGVLRSNRGAAGGFRLAREPGAVTLQHVVSVFSPIERRCLLGNGICGRNPECAVHELWAPVASQLHGFLSTTTFGDLSRSHSQWEGGVV